MIREAVAILFLGTIGHVALWGLITCTQEVFK